MERHLFLTGQTELHGSLVALNSMQARMRENHASGLIEVKVGTMRQIMLVYANGAQAGVYLLEEGRSRPFNLSELSALWGGAPFAVSTVGLPDRAGRAIWLIVESHKRDQMEIRGNEAWQKVLQELEKEGFSGAVEISSRLLQGFVVLRKGKVIDSETVFFNGQGFENRLPPNFDIQEHWQVTTYVPSSTGSWQCLSLRLGGAHWTRDTLSRFQAIAGEKFLHVVDREVSLLLEPLKWNISVNGVQVADEHFFATAESTAHAYRALMMGLGAQMGFVIGNTLTQRILTEIFEEMDREERAALEAYRLIPAAFTL